VDHDTNVTGSSLGSGLVADEIIYANPLATDADIAQFRMEGEATLSFPAGRLRMENSLDAALGQRSNFVLWCPETFPKNMLISWDFWPVREPGLCILFFAARGRDGKDLFDSSLAPRDGRYERYHHGDIDAYHVSYYRRFSFPQEEKGMHLCNLRKSYGFHLVAQAADPLPAVEHSWPPYRMELAVCEGRIQLWVEGLPVLSWTDDGTTGGPPLDGGLVGFRQMAPLVAEYANLQVRRIEKAPAE
jgi:hypothetical protein